MYFAQEFAEPLVAIGISGLAVMGIIAVRAVTLLGAKKGWWGRCCRRRGSWG